MNHSPVHKGSLLIATPYMPDPFFRKTVILICEHSHVGTFGLILNKQFELDIPEELSELKESENPYVFLKIGGPVQPTQLMLLHDRKEMHQTLEILPGIFLGGDLDFLQQNMQDPLGAKMALCFGYSGWGPTELEQDISSGFWIVSEAKAEDILSSTSQDLWKKSLKNMGGKFASLAIMPDHLEMN